MLTAEDVKRITKAEILSKVPTLAAQLDAITDDDLLGTTAEENRDERYGEVLTYLGEQQGLDAWDYQLWVVEQLGHDVAHIRAEAQRQHDANLGLG